MAIIQTTIAGLKTLAAPSIADTYYTTDIGQEGNWRYDSTDTSSSDNIGTILVSTVGIFRFKRIYDEYINAKWFGAKGDGVTDDTDAINAAVICAYNYHLGELFFPAGIYLTNTITIDPPDVYNGKVTIRGVGKDSTIFKGITQLANYFPVVGECMFIIPFYPQTVPIFHVVAPAGGAIHGYLSFCHFSIWGNFFGVPDISAIYQYTGTGTEVCYNITGHYEHIGILLEQTAEFYIEDVEIKGCEICVQGNGALIFNMNNFRLGGTSRTPNECANYGIVLDSSIDGILPNQITLTNGSIKNCLIKGVDFGKGSLLTLRSVDIENNGSTYVDIHGNIVGDPNTGGVFIRNDMNALSQINVYDCWFESNMGYTFYTQPVQDTILNFYGCHFLTGYKLGESLGVNLTLSGINNPLGKININGCVASILPNFIINADYSVIITSVFSNIPYAFIDTSTYRRTLGIGGPFDFGTSPIANLNN